MTTNISSCRQDVYSRVTNKIIADLEKGAPTWLKPWSAANTEGRIVRPLRHSGEPYKGINVLMLWAEAIDKGFISPMWMTYRQAQELGGQVRKGESGSLVVYADRISRSETNEQGEEIAYDIPFMKGYTVFNTDQVDGLPERYRFTPTAPLPSSLRIARADAFTTATCATVRHGGNQAFYAVASDQVQLPIFESFRDPESYYATLLHELTHWTRHPSRLAREFGRKRWGDEGYAAEELVAELGAAFLCADLEIALTPRPDHAAYLASWLKVLKADSRAVFTAAAHAQRASDFLHGFQAKLHSEAA